MGNKIQHVSLLILVCLRCKSCYTLFFMDAENKEKVREEIMIKTEYIGLHYVVVVLNIVNLLAAVFQNS